MTVRIFLITALALLSITSCSSVPTKSSSYPSPDGNWSGAIPFGDSSSESLELRISIDGTRARVWTVHAGSRIEVKPGTFRVQRHLSNAVIHSMDSGQDEDGTWVESWVLVVTPVTQDKLLVTWSRVVNNIDLERESSKFSSQASGIIQRLST